MINQMLELFVLVVPLLLLCGWLVWKCVVVPRGYRSFPVCEKCRAEVAVANDLRCPSCGVDLRVTGITTPSMEMQRRSSLAGGMIGWSLAIAVTALFGLWYAAACAAERAWLAAGPTTQTTTATFGSRSSLFKSIAASAAVTSQPSVMSRHSHLEFKLTTNDDRVLTLLVDDPVNQSPLVSDDGTGKAIPGVDAVDLADVTAFLAAAGVDAKSKAGKDAANDLYDLVSTPFRLEIIVFTGSTPSSSQSSSIRGASLPSELSVVTTAGPVTTGGVGPAGVWNGALGAWLLAIVGFAVVLLISGLVYIPIRRSKLARGTPQPLRISSGEVSA